MLPVIALVGRPNVGKSTLFNRLTRRRDALVADYPGLTRDRLYGYGHCDFGSYVVIDTGGVGHTDAVIAKLAGEQAWQAVAEADMAIFVTDARAGLHPEDHAIAAALRRTGKPVQVVVNKAEGLAAEFAGAEFHDLGLGMPQAISAAHGDGISVLMEVLWARLGHPAAQQRDEPEDAAIRVAIVGRPNVGKSTLVNRLVGDTRVLTGDQPGTTRDRVEVPFQSQGRAYVLIDTAGLRRASRVDDPIERLSVVHTLRALEDAHVAVLVLDARTGVHEQDAHLLGWVLESGRALVIAVNKWDGLTVEARNEVRRGLELKLAFVTFAEQRCISALHGSGVGELMDAVAAAYDSAMCKLSTPRVTRALREAVAAYPPPRVRGRPIQLRYAHQGGSNPPLIIVHGNQTAEVPDAYTRYLTHALSRAFKIAGTPLRVEYRSGDNPYKGRKNILTPRQHKKRVRLLRHVKRRG